MKIVNKVYEIIIEDGNARLEEIKGYISTKYYVIGSEEDGIMPTLPRKTGYKIKMYYIHEGGDYNSKSRMVYKDQLLFSYAVE